MDEPTRQHNSKSWVDQRAKDFREENPDLSTKVGLIGSQSGAGRAAQAVGSFVTPGDLSDIRSPIRSTIAETLTPGGGRRLRPRLGKPNERGYRCPEGYQFGGRFTDSQWSTCGRQLFDLPNLLPSLLQIANSVMRPQTTGVGTDRPNVTALRGQEISGVSLVQRRAADIPRVGLMDKKKREDGIRVAIDGLVESLNVPSMMIRRDGFPMQPVVTFGELRKVPDNRNMEDAAFLINAANVDGFGKEELGLLSNTGVTSLVYVLPNGSTIRMDKTRPLSVGERRKLGKTVSSAEQIDNSNNPLARLNAVVEASDGAISLREDFSKIRNANDLLDSGKEKGKPRWVVEAFKPAGKRKRVSAQQIAQDAKPSAKPEVSKNIANLENAIELINNGGNLSEIDPSILTEAIRRARVYRQKKISAKRTLFTRDDGGVGFLEIADGQKYEHLGAHFSSAIQEHLELPTAKVRIAGQGEERPYLVQQATTIIPDSTVVANGKLSDAPREDIVGILVSDYLTDVRKRNPSSLTHIQAGDTRRLVSSSSAPSALVGLSTQELEKRRALDLPDYLKQDGNVLFGELARSPEEVRRQIVAIYESLIQRARAFKWDDYLKKLRVDGRLSQPEQRHMEIVQTLFEQRLDRLAKSKEQFAKLLDVQ